MTDGSLSRSRIALLSTGLFLITVAIYVPVRQYEFVRYDDGDYILRNQHVTSGITSSNLAWALTTFRSSNWHPVTWLSHMLDANLWGLNPAGHHLTSLLFHAMNTVLLFWLFARMTGALWRSAFVAAVFALHPLHVESVAWISERKDVLSTFFLFLTIGAYLYYVRRPQRSSYLVVLFCYALGLMSKPMLVTLPFLLLLLDYWPLQRTDICQGGRSKWRVLIIEKTPFILLAIVSSAITFLAQHRAGSVMSMDRLPLQTRLANAVLNYSSYISKYFWPTDLAVFYPMRESVSLWPLIGAVAVLTAGTICAVRMAKRYPYFATGWFWFVGTLVPVIGIVQVGDQAMADRYMYVPLIGLTIVLAWGSTELMGLFYTRPKRAKVILAAAAVTVLAGCGTVTARQLTYWHDTLSLFQHALAVTTNNWFAHGNVAVSLGDQGDIAGAISHYRELLRIRPDSIEALNNLAWYLATSQDSRIRNEKEALVLAQRALSLSRSPTANTLDTLAAALAENHQFDAAVEKAEEARRLALSLHNTDLAGRIGQRLELYKQGLTYRK